jgi:hypothetical protein
VLATIPLRATPFRTPTPAVAVPIPASLGASLTAGSTLGLRLARRGPIGIRLGVGRARGTRAAQVLNEDRGRRRLLNLDEREAPALSREDLVAELAGLNAQRLGGLRNGCFEVSAGKRGHVIRLRIIQFWTMVSTVLTVM